MKHKNRDDDKNNGDVSIMVWRSRCVTCREGFLPAGSYDGRPYNADVEFVALLLDDALRQSFGVGVRVGSVPYKSRCDVTDDVVVHPSTCTRIHTSDQQTEVVV